MQSQGGYGGDGEGTPGQGRQSLPSLPWPLGYRRRACRLLKTTRVQTARSGTRSHGEGGLRAEQHGTDNDLEHAAVRAIYAYEEALSHVRGKRTRATGTWQMVARHGVIEAVAKRLSSRNGEDMGEALSALGMQDYSFEAVRDAYPQAFEQQQAA